MRSFLITKFRILDHGLNKIVEKLTYPRVRVEVDPNDPNLRIKNLDIVDKKCSLSELAKSIGEIGCFILKHFRKM
ncbi:MAG TPA: hypothetical protein VK155_06560 [Bacteroidales bacterium]|nr:hypothetical protein [Bacteroidales bacterium]